MTKPKSCELYTPQSARTLERRQRWNTCSFRTMARVMLVFCVATIAGSAQTLNTLVNFDGNNGETPFYMSLIQGFDGNYYGTTSWGGLEGWGTVFRMTPTARLTTLYSFCGQCASNRPYAGLVQATNGRFYGTTVSSAPPDYAGSVFEITAAGKLTTLHDFDSQDGTSPLSALVQATNGRLYGTTQGCCSYSAGTVFEITTAGTLTTLYNFGSGASGAYPYAGLIQASDGSFYGTTSQGGANGYGTVFKITAAGKLTTLYSFCSRANCADGSYPYGGLVQATDGSFYGMTNEGGSRNNGTVFKMTTAGELTTLHSFRGPDGANPVSGLVQGTDGQLYGMAPGLGAHGYGTVFRVSTKGVLTTLHSFDGNDGSYPLGGLIQGTDGSFYGATTYGGNSNHCYGGGCGTIFRLSMGLRPFVETLPKSGEVGATVFIVGSNLTGATSVTFNGIPTKFTVISKSEIKTTVPSGAGTGKVKVTTSGSTLISNAAFRVGR